MADDRAPAPLSPEAAALPRLALSIRQPWAWAIINAGKDVENRNWRTPFRGPFCIHAAKGMTNAEWEDALDFIDHAFPVPLASKFGRRASAVNSTDANRGGIVGVASITACVEESDSAWFFGRYGFVLDEVRAVPFLPVKGALGFFDWRAAILRAEPTE